MRNGLYVAATAFFLAIVVSLASGPVMAAPTQETEHPIGGSSMPRTTDQMRSGMQGEMSGHMQGEMPQHMQGRMPEQMKGMMTDHGKAAGSGQGKAEFSGEAKTGVSEESQTGMTRREAATNAPRSRDVKTPPTEGASAEHKASDKGAVGHAVVTGIDRPENCLRIRRGPSTSYDVIGCAADGETLNLTGVFSSDGRWAQLDNNGWVFAGQIKTDVKPPRSI